MNDVYLIDTLKRRYARHCDARDLSGLLTLFASEAVCVVGSGVVWSGIEEIEQGYRSAFAAPRGMHVVSNGQVLIAEDSQSASGSWYMQRMSLDPADGGLIQLGVYEDTFVRASNDLGWSIASLALSVAWTRAASK